MLLNTDNPIQRRKSFPFRFQNAWCQYSQVNTIVEKQWSTHIQGTRMFKLTHKLTNTKHQLKKWMHNYLGNVQQNLQSNLQKIGLVEEKLLHQPDSLRLNSWLNYLLKQREKLLLFNQKYWGNLRRKEWLTCGDRNSKFFQQRAINKHKQKLVHKLKNDCGSWMDQQSEIAGKFIFDYNQRFKAAHNATRVLTGINMPIDISQADNLMLVKIPNISEIKDALFSKTQTKHQDRMGLAQDSSNIIRSKSKAIFANVFLNFLEMEKYLNRSTIHLSL